MSAALKSLNLGLRALMELGTVVALGYWGYTIGKTTGASMLLGIAVPMIGFGFWGLIDFRQTGPLAEPLRLIQELVISGLAALAWYAAGAETLGWVLGSIAIVHHVVLYLTGETLLKERA